RGDANGHGLEFRMIDVGGNDHAAGSDFRTHQLGRELLATGDIGHLFADDAAAGEMHLRQIGVAGLGSLGLALPDPFGARRSVRVAVISFAWHEWPNRKLYAAWVGGPLAGTR